MTRRHLKIFVAVTECGKMSEAAKKLFITQSSVSQAISEIEKEYGILLFERLSRSLYITDVGREFLSYAKRSLAIDDEMSDFLRTSSKYSTVKIGATVTVGTCIISKLVSQLNKYYDKLNTEVVVGNTRLIENLLLKSELDIGLVEGRIVNPDLIVRQAIKDRLVLICPNGHPFCSRSSVDIRELESQPLILREKGSGTRAQLENQLKEAHIYPNVTWDCCNTEAIINAVIHGHGISVISERLVKKYCYESKLWMCDVNGMNLLRSFDLVYHKDKYISDIIDTFMGLCLNYKGEDAENE